MLAKENPLRCFRLLLISVGVIPETAKANGLEPYAYLRYVYTGNQGQITINQP